MLNIEVKNIVELRSDPGVNILGAAKEAEEILRTIYFGNVKYIVFVFNDIEIMVDKESTANQIFAAYIGKIDGMDKNT